MAAALTDKQQVNLVLNGDFHGNSSFNWRCQRHQPTVGLLTGASLHWRGFWNFELSHSKRLRHARQFSERWSGVY